MPIENINENSVWRPRRSSGGKGGQQEAAAVVVENMKRWPKRSSSSGQKEAREGKEKETTLCFESMFRIHQIIIAYLCLKNYRNDLGTMTQIRRSNSLAKVHTTEVKNMRSNRFISQRFTTAKTHLRHSYRRRSLERPILDSEVELVARLISRLDPPQHY